MKRLIIIIFMLTFASFAQQNRVKITGGDGDMFMAPLYSPDGTMIAFTSQNYRGIWIYRFSENSVEELTDETASGFGFSWSQDSRYILSRVAQYEGMKRLNAVKIFDIQSKESQNLSGYKSYMPALPQWSYGDSKVFIYTKELEVYSTNRLAKAGSSSKIAFIKENKVAVGDIVTENMKIYNPFAGETLLSLSLSPDGSKVTFEVMGGNMYVMNSDGTGLKDLGKGYIPKWSPDSRSIVFMVTEDDGHKIDVSDIYLINADGTGRKSLTNTDDKLEMNPSFSPDGRNIVYDEATEGAIYTMKLD